MNAVTPICCRVDAPEAEAAFQSFKEVICGGRSSQRYALLSHHTGSGPRCLLDSSGRCLDADTPWAMTRAMLGPLFRFDETLEWVALFPMDNWRKRCDDALAASLAESAVSWSQLLATQLAGELPSLPRLIISR